MVTTALPSGNARRLDGRHAWAEAADLLARWAMDTQVNRTDVWGGYWTDATGVVNRATWPAKKYRGHLALTPDVLARHFRAGRADDLVGTHTTSPDNTSKWGALDVDAHGDGGNNPDTNLRVVVALYGELLELGFNPLLAGSNGSGGYHLRLLFSRPAPTSHVHYFMRTLAARAVELGLPAAPETFPKQPAVAPGMYGNWLRLPGRHHSRDYWSQVYLWGRWWSGATAVQAMLELEPSDPDLLPEPPPPPARSPAPPGFQAERSADRLTRRILAYIDRLPRDLAVGNGRDNHAFRLAAFCLFDLQVSDHAALLALEQYDSRNAAPKGRQRLEEILANARRYGKGAAR